MKYKIKKRNGVFPDSGKWIWKLFSANLSDPVDDGKEDWKTRKSEQKAKVSAGGRKKSAGIVHQSLKLLT